MTIFFCLIKKTTVQKYSPYQTIHLNTGWNAIFLEVFPDEPNPDFLFKDTPITQVLTIFAKDSSVQFIEDPKEMDWKNETWFRWILLFTKDKN
ncbi:hypothetical protein MHK_005506 [Candidatus Magnetomorum sp. HK-1]|nr:hypothetical protein MHK_005506 [Candidatus Magnetomorum sp. HK-1]